VKLKELPEFNQTSMKPLKKYHNKLSSLPTKNEKGSTADVNKQRKEKKRGAAIRNYWHV
jgi:uncharacterized protein YciW